MLALPDHTAGQLQCNESIECAAMNIMGLTSGGRDDRTEEGENAS
jgi:hypothetical protein